MHWLPLTAVSLHLKSLQPVVADHTLGALLTVQGCCYRSEYGLDLTKPLSINSAAFCRNNVLVPNVALIAAHREWTGAAGGSPILFPNIATTCIDSACCKQDPLFAL
jgi:hypothetical protein